MWRPVSFAADKNRPYPRRTAIVIIVLALFTLLLPLLEGGKKRKFSFLSFRLFLPWKMDASRILEDQIHITSIYISRYLYTRYYRDLIKRREKFAIPLREIPANCLGRQILFHHAVGREDSYRSNFMPAQTWPHWRGRAFHPGETKRGNGYPRRRHCADDRLTMIYDTRAFASAISVPVQSELCRFINRVDALTGRGINLCNNLTDPRRIDRKKKRPRSIVERFLEF